MKAPDDLQGRSLVPMLKDAGTPGREVAYTVVSRGQVMGKSVRTERWRYARWPDGEVLFDLLNDVEEHDNLAKSPERTKTMREMRRLLKDAETRAVGAKR